MRDSTEPTDVVLTFFDMLGFSERFQQIGLTKMLEEYLQIVAATKDATGGAFMTAIPEPDGTASGIVLARQGGNYAYFSDTFLLWERYEPALIEAFLFDTASFFCHSLKNGIRIRGAVSFGEAILHAEDGIFLGTPIIDGARGESAQKWLGISFGSSLTHEHRWIGELTYLVPYTKHIKAERADQVSQYALNWVTRWRQLFPGHCPKQAVMNLSSGAEHSLYYDNTLAFIDACDQQDAWWLGCSPDELPVAGYVRHPPPTKGESGPRD